MLVVAARAFVGAVLVVAAVSKFLRGKDYTTNTIRSYQILPEPAVGAVAAALPWLEIALGVGLMTPAASAVSVGAAVLFASFAFAVAGNLVRGRRGLSCGCFGLSSSHRIGWRLVAGDLGLGLVMVWSAMGDEALEGEATVATPLVGLVFTGLLVVSAALRALGRASVGSNTLVSDRPTHA